MTDADPPPDPHSPVPPWWAVAGLVILPLLVAALVLSQRSWYPVLDMAMTEFRVRDVGTVDTPLIGLPGRIGTFPDQGSHPGPWSFYLVAPIYRLVGSTAWGMELASVVLNAVAASLVLWITHRRGRPVVTLAMAALLALAVRGYGLEVLTHPWNPYFPLLLWLLALVGTWSVLEGDRWMLLAVVGAGSVAAQTHVPYLLPCLALNALALGALAWRWGKDGDRRSRTALLGGIGFGAFLWLPPFVEQFTADEGNISRLIDHFTGTPPEDPIGLVEGTTVFFRHLDLPRGLARMTFEDSSFFDISGQRTGIAFGGVLVFLFWSAAVVVAWRMRHRTLIHLHTVVGVALAVGWLSMSRIFGRVWFYLTLWAWGTALLAALASLWTFVAYWRQGRSAGERATVARAMVGMSAVLLIAATALSTVAASWIPAPEEHISELVEAASDPTADALEAGVGAAVGKDGTYVVFWQDAAYIGSPGYGVMNELERQGFDVGVHRTWYVPAGEHRVVEPGEVDAEVHVVTGGYIDEWRTRPDHVEVLVVDTRSPDEQARYAEIERMVVDDLEAIGRDDIAAEIEVNLFGAMLTPDLPREIVAVLEEMHALSIPLAVFIAPPGSSS